jgi:regulator of RNase E activity RraA
MARRKTAKRLSDLDLSTRYGRLYSGPIYDVLAKMGRPNQVLDLAIKPLLPTMTVAGVAYTIRSERRNPDDPDRPKVDIVGGMTPGCVAVYSVGREQQSGHWGELTSNASAAKGCRGVVVDGGARDSTEHLKIPKWSCFCRYTSPIEFGTRGRITAVQVPVLMSGSLTTVVPVKPGDVVFGDLDGVIVIPREMALDVLAEAEDVVAREKKGRALIRQGVDMSEVKRRQRVG